MGVKVSGHLLLSAIKNSQEFLRGLLLVVKSSILLLGDSGKNRISHEGYLGEELGRFTLFLNDLITVI
jgi:hypothetical protein